MATLYVDLVNGNDSNGGTYASPKLTFSSAYTAASSGDTITFKTSVSATYTLAANVTAYASPINKSLTINSENNALIIDGGNSYYYTIGNFSASLTYTIEGITWINNKISTGNIGLIGNQQTGESSATLTIRNCRFLNTSLNGVQVACVGFVNNHTPTGSIFTVENCVFTGNGSGGSSTSFVSAFRGGNSIFFRNNVFFIKSGDAPPTGIFRINGVFTTGSYINSNIMENRGTSAVSINAFGGSNFTFDNNNYYTAAQFSSIPSGSNNITTNPMLVSPTEYNFFLRQNSPALGTGKII